MKKMLKKVKLYYFEDDVVFFGKNSIMSGNCTGLSGDCTGLEGNIDCCETSQEEREKGIDILELIKE